MGVLLLVIDVALVALVEVMTWLGLTGKCGQGNIPTPLTTSIPIMFRPAMSPTLRLTLRPSLSPQNCFTPTPLLQLAADDEKFGDQVGRSVPVFGGWSIFCAPNSNNTKGRAYLYKIFLEGSEKA